MQEEVQHKNRETRKLIARWEDAEEEVLALNERLDEAIKEGDYFYS